MIDPKVPVPTFTVSRKLLMATLRQVIRGCARGSAALLNTCVMLDARSSKDGNPPYLLLGATDLIVSIRSKVPFLSCSSEGVFAIPGSRLFDVISAMRGSDEIIFMPVQKKDTLTVLVSTGRAERVEFPYIDPSGFPHIYTSQQDGVIRYKLPSGDLERALRSVKHASNSDTVSNFHGVFLSHTPTAACSFSEQASAVINLPLPTGLISAAGVLLPLSTVEIVLGLCDQAPEVEMGVKTRDGGGSGADLVTPIRVYLRDKFSEIAISLPANRFVPALPGKIASQADDPIWSWHKVNRDDLASALKLMLTVLSGGKGDPIAMARFDKGILHLSAQGDAGLCEQEVPSNTPQDYTFTDADPPTRECGLSISHWLAHLNCPAVQAAEEIEIGIKPQPATMQYLRPLGDIKYLGVVQSVTL